MKLYAKYETPHHIPNHILTGYTDQQKGKIRTNVIIDNHKKQHKIRIQCLSSDLQEYTGTQKKKKTRRGRPGNWTRLSVHAGEHRNQLARRQYLGEAHTRMDFRRRRAVGIMGQRTDFHMITLTEIIDSDVRRNSRERMMRRSEEGEEGVWSGWDRYEER